jgi:16S rRNA processing protein RimM
VNEDGSPLGTVEEILNNGPAPTLVIRRPGGEEIMAPFADDFVREVDLERGRLVLRPPELFE